MIEKLLENFRESIAVLSISLALIFICIFIWTKVLKKEALKVVGILIVLGVSLFANEATSYFLAILVLATLVTNLEFLQNIAAIIRNSDAYFNHLVGTRSQKEIEASITDEIEAVEKAIESDISQESKSQTDNQINLTLNKSNLNPMQFALIAEEYTFKFLENKYGQFINRYVKISGTKKRVEFDGIMLLDKKSVVLEIKISRHGYYPKDYIIQSIEKNTKYIKEFDNRFTKNVELRFIFVGNINEKFKERILGLEPGNDYMIHGVDLQFEFYSFDEIGLKDILNIEDNKES
ncbi:hypothetical protein [Paenibacillus glycinis]|uniref:Uncharacterized protein n=1 Tax=Paenibacillus glycinis TaxID=2697035 RepID=A0ABW9XRY7_9BACL|nr:hypothetical protein [Paenibacillus glycinis]NBD25414.1 hypothetical protein [Paenibacillus glycinis]